jgi:hypothetical protein
MAGTIQHKHCTQVNTIHENTAMRFRNISWKMYFVTIHVII